MRLFELNNHAVALFLKGDYESSGAVFQSALSQVQLPGEEDEDKDLMNYYLEEDEANSLLTVAVDRCLAAENEDNTSAFSRYDRAFLVSNDHPFRTPAVLLYNMALLYHHGATACNSADLFWTKAYRLYNSALEFIDLGADHYDVGHLMLAVLNNMGHLHSLRVNYQDSRSTFQRLGLILQSSLKQRVFVPDTSLTDEDVGIFMTNVALLHHPGAMGTAPAA